MLPKMDGKLEELLALAYQARRERRLEEARRLSAEAVGLGRCGGPREDLARALTGLGQIERDADHPAEARRLYQEAAEIYRSTGDALRLAHSVRHVGDIYLDEGNVEQAQPCYEEALARYRTRKDTPALDLANAIRGYAILKQELGCAQEAKSLWEEARELYAAVKVEAGVTEAARRIAQLDQRLAEGK